MKTSLKVRTLNFLRNIFRIKFMESFLASQTFGKGPSQWICKLVPNPYQYSAPTFRSIKRNGIVMGVDISDYIGHYLYFGFEDAGANELFFMCKENFTVLDIGANIGWTVLNLASITKHGMVIGFEPDPYNFERCNENIALNNFKNIKIFPVGLGNGNDLVDMEVRTPSNRGGNRIVGKGSPSTHRVEIVKLDDFAPVRDLTKIDMLKIDVEGYELNVLRGAAYLLKKHKPVLFVELDDNNLKDQGDSALDLINFLLAIGYSEIRHAEDKTEVLPTTDFSNCHFDVIVN